MKRQIPLIITFLVGFIVIFSEFIPQRFFGQISSTLEEWFLIISGFAIILGQLSLFKVNFLKIKFKQPNWPYYIVTLISFVVMVGFGAFWGTETSSGFLGDGAKIVATLGDKPFDYLFHNVYQHLSATMFSLLAFFIASAAYRAFIARNVESNLLLIAAVLVMLGNTSLGSALTGWLPESLKFLHLPRISEFIMKYPNTAGQRAIMIGAGLGLIGSSLRIILGIERSYLGGK
ncbi:MAG: hypothetical protein K9N09_04175 [Candidatus Cloacimonetes bacterium]|nr:hypothetical protein [Candidatus Cloacimonadota bacterium]MCF7814484.1 hypothetical protein [Candidatus Cloacimonadota bacterium]MCF7867876.1 hypothetical protein [Candidatus Cloacimonadota bacterium]MCF7883695.1 hypothetical protein [Candidatus Cloacimonadota bacterium]